MIVIDKDNKNLVIPNGLGNINRDYQEGYEIGYQESFEDGKAEGLAEGRAEGLAEGRAIGIEEGKQIQKDLLETITITENGLYQNEDGYNEVNVEIPLQEKEERLNDATENFSILPDEGYVAMTKVNVEIPLQEKEERLNDATENFSILPDEGYVAMTKVNVDISDALSTKYEEGLEEGKDIIINSLQTLNVTENGTYTPPTMPFLRLYDDDKYEIFHPTDNNAFEIKFRLNGDGYREFFSQNGNDINFIGLRADPYMSELFITWYNKQITISDVDFSKWHTLVVKMLDENARVILDGEVYNDYTEVSSYESNGQYVEIYGNIDLEHFRFWNTWEQYNNGVIPYFNFKVTPEGLMRNYKGGEYSVVNNIGGGSAQYMDITEGWKEVIVDVPQEGGDINPDTLREITITENGIYTSKYSELIKTGEFEDGTPFYGFGKVNGAVYDTEINLFDVGGDLESLEFWYKGDYQDVADGWNIILSSNSEDSTDEGSVEFRYKRGNSLYVRIGGIERYFNLEEGVWHHFKLDNMCTLFVDDVEIFTFPRPLPTFTNFYINGSVYNEEFTRTANGYFGLIRINDEVIIPTEEGFMNLHTGDILPTLKEGSYTYGNYDDYGEPYKTINVDVNIPLQEKNEWRNNTEEIFTILPDEGFDGMSKVEVNIYEPLQAKYNEGYERGIAEGGGGVPSKIDVAEYGIKFGNSTFTEVPDFYDFSNLINAENLFRSCSALQTIPLIDTSNVTNMSYMFANCSNLQTIPLINTRNVTNMEEMFANCSNLQTIPLIDTSNVTGMTYMFDSCSALQTIPLIDTSNISSMYRMFYRCSKLQTIPELDTSNVTAMNYMFYEASNLISLPALNATKVTNINYYFGTNNLEKLTDVGGWIGLNINWNDDRGLTKCPNLTYQSCINILNGLDDVTELGGRTLKVHQNFIDLVGDEISIGIAKGWSISA